MYDSWVEKLTIRTFNEDLKDTLPFVYKLVGTTVTEVSASDIINTPASADTVKVFAPRFKEAEKYENMLNQIIGEANGVFSKNSSQDQAIEALNQLMANEFPVGADGTNAIESIKGIIEDPELDRIFKELAEISPEMDARAIIADYVKIKDEEYSTDVSSKLQYSPDAAPVEEPTPVEEPVEETPPEETEPVEEPEAAPTDAAPPEGQEQQVTASFDHGDNKFVNAVNRAKSRGAKPNDTMMFKGKRTTLRDAIKAAGLQVEAFFPDEKEDNDEILEFVKSMYDAETGKFPRGETGVILATQKQFGDHASQIAHHAIKELSSMYEAKSIRRLAGL